MTSVDGSIRMLCDGKPFRTLSLLHYGASYVVGWHSSCGFGVLRGWFSERRRKDEIGFSKDFGAIQVTKMEM
jgi:hypothetical protein